jgi:hypothetical protein
MHPLGLKEPVPERLPTTPEAWIENLRKLEAHDHRAGLVRVTGRKLAEFYDALDDECFSDAANVMREIAFDPKNKIRTKLRAVQAAIRPVADCVKMLPALMKAGNNVAVQTLARRMTAYMETWEEGDFTKLAKLLVQAYKDKSATYLDRVRAVEATIGSALTILDSVLEMQRQAEEMASHIQYVNSDITMIADAEMDEMIAAAQERERNALGIETAAEVGPHAIGDEGTGWTGSGEGVGQGQQEDVARQERQEVSEVEEVING